MLECQGDAVLHLHGRWDRPTSVVLGIRSYAAMLGHRLAQHLQRVVATTHSLLFIGCGTTFENPNFKALLDWMAGTFKDLGRRHYLLATEGGREAIGRLLPPTSRIWVPGYGERHDELLPYLHGLRAANGFARPRTDNSGAPHPEATPLAD